MRKIIAKIILSILILNTLLRGGIVGESFALFQNWDLNTPADYTLSSTATSYMYDGAIKLIPQLNQEGFLANNNSTAYLDTARRVTIDGDYAYVSAYNQDRIQAIDMSDPTAPVPTSNLQNNNGTHRLDGPMDTAIKGNYLYVASYNSDAIQIIDITNPAAMVGTGNYVNNGSVRLNGPRGLDIQGNYLYVASFANDAIQIFDISTPTSLVPAGNLRDVIKLDGARDITVDGNYAYVSVRNGDRITIVDISSPSSPTIVSDIIDNSGTIKLDSIWGMSKSGNYAYGTAYNDDGIQIVDISNPASMTAVGYIGTPDISINGPRDVIVDGDYMYIADYIGDSVVTVDISIPSSPIFINEIVNGGGNRLNGIFDLEKVGEYIHGSSYSDDDYVILKQTFTDTSPSITHNDNIYYGGSIDKITTTYGAGNQGNVTYQISKDNGTTWYYYNGSTRVTTTSGAINSNTSTEINAEIQTFNGLAGGTGFFKWKAFLNSNGVEQTKLDNVKVDFTSGIFNEIIDFETPGGYTVTSGTWSRTITNPQESTYSLESGNHTNNSESCFEVDRDIFADAKIKFYKEVSSEVNYDFLKFYIDGSEKGNWSGAVPWSLESYALTIGNHNFKWCYNKDTSVSSGSDTAWVDYIEIVEEPIIPEVTILDFEVVGGYTVTTAVSSPGPDWERITSEKYEGSYSLESQNTTDNSTACFERPQTIGGTDTGITFYRKVSSESNYDFLRFYIDGTLQDSWSGEQDWNKETYNLSAGSYTLRWCYQKDGSISTGSDRAWIDLVNVTQDAPILFEETPVLTPTNDSTPDYTFYSPVAGTISYSGSCSSSSTGAIIGNNTITFNSLGDGIYTDCTIQVLTTPENSTILNVTNFTIDTTGIDITINIPLDAGTISNADFNIDVSYYDAETGVNTGSIILDLRKWNGTSYGADISGTYISFTGATITSTGASYPTSALGTGDYKLTFTIDDNIGNDSNSISVFTVTAGDTTPPIISSSSPNNNSLYPNAGFNISYEYNDAGTGIDTGSIVLELKRWNGASYGSDISGTYVNFIGSTVTSSGANYPTYKLGYGKYLIDFTVEDNSGNPINSQTILYIDEPEFIISSGSLDMGNLSGITPSFSPEVTVTVKTVGAAFTVTLNKNLSPSITGDNITDWDTSTGFGYDKEVYTGNINLINTDEIIATQTELINTNGNKNTYTYNLKLGALINNQQSAGDYEGTVDFGIDFNY